MNQAPLNNQYPDETIKDIKLNALLEITKAINNNATTAQLLDIYQEILENRLNVGKLVLFSFSTEWTCILKYGVSKSYNHLEFEPELLAIKDIETLSYSKGYLSKRFEIVIPIYHKQTPLAYVLLGDIDETKVEMSASIQHLPFIQTLTNIIIVAIENKKLYKTSIQKATIQKELQLAQDMQKLLFPSNLPKIEELEMNALYLPHQQVGGDYYDVIWINEVEMVFCLADVSGKGVAAALLMSNLQAALRVQLNYTQNLTEIVIGLNQLICENTKTEKFISLFIAKYNIGTKKLSYINAGHNAPLLLNDSQTISLDKGCTLLGICNPLVQIEQDVLEITPHSILFAYTDGLTDTLNSQGENISIEEIQTILQNNRQSNCEFINKAMLYYLEEFKGEMPFVDDIAFLTSKFH